ncbi:hypothetical protein EXIGLDRAFT_696227 [Exidia glandulosa HHB12029]|uniref:Uncharacterized protein n=1 Tax=Exidia glandulosa HHB12029 TaxID=1314781 RepID=A0A165FGX0_EXIGL|nr:hypothetical protein EXIGLDRAFT_696227 [Exidia glandulosa HHB12029]
MSGYSQQGGSGGGGGGSGSGSGGSSGQGTGCQRCGNPFDSYVVTSPDGSVTYHACPPSVVRQYAQTQGAARASGMYCRTCQWVYAAFASYNTDHPSGHCSKGHPDYQGQRPLGTYYCPMCKNTYDNANLFLQEHSGGGCRGRRA